MAPGVAENLYDQIRGAVRNLGIFSEIGRAGDEDAELEHLGDVGQTSVRRSCDLGDDVERGCACGRAPLFDRQLGAEPSAVDPPIVLRDLA